MEFSQLQYVFIVVGLLSIVIEMIVGAATGFELFVLGVCGLVSGFIGAYFGSDTVALGVFVTMMLLYIFFVRRIIKTKLAVTTTHTNIDKIIGDKGKVVREITPTRTGQVKIDDETWRARCTEKVAVGETVIVESVSGVTLQVRKA